MAKLKAPKQPKIGASANTWKRYEQKLERYVSAKNEMVRRKSVREQKLSKIKI